jgi:hypothetical protein
VGLSHINHFTDRMVRHNLDFLFAQRRTQPGSAVSGSLLESAHRHAMTDSNELHRALLLSVGQPQCSRRCRLLPSMRGSCKDPKSGTAARRSARRSAPGRRRSRGSLHGACLQQ